MEKYIRIIYLALKLQQSITIVFFALLFSIPSQAFNQEYDDSILNRLHDNLFANFEQYRQKCLPINYLGVRLSDVNTYIIRSVLGATEIKEHNHYYDHSVNIKIGSQKSLYYKPSVLNTLNKSYSHGVTYENLNNCYSNINNSIEELYLGMTNNPIQLYTTADGDTIDLQSVRFYEDFSPKCHYAELEPQETINMDYWENTLNDICSLFRSSEHQTFITADFTCTYERRYFVNSAGSEEVTNYKSFLLTLNATITADDECVCPLERRFLYNSLEDMPSKEQLLHEAKDMLSILKQLYYSSSLDNYDGPVLFGQEASGVLFHELIGHRLEAKNSVNEVSKMMEQENTQIFPSFLQICDNPQETYFKGKSLAGHYLFDDEGVPSQKVDCVRDGVLLSLLTSGKSYYEGSISNGHGRGVEEPEARQGNLFIYSSCPVPDNKLRETLMTEIRNQKLDFGYYIPNITSGSAIFKKGLFDMADFTANDDFMITVDYVCKIYADGSPDEIIRGGSLVSSCKELLHAINLMGDNPTVNNGYCQTRSGSVPVSLVAPRTLVKRMKWTMVKDVRTDNHLLDSLPEIEDIRIINNKHETILNALTDELSALKKMKSTEDTNPYYLDIHIHDDSYFCCDASKEKISCFSQSYALRGNIAVCLKDGPERLRTNNVRFLLPYTPDYYVIRNIVRKNGIVSYKDCINKNVINNVEFRHFSPFFLADSTKKRFASSGKLQHTAQKMLKEMLKHNELKNPNVRLTQLQSDDYSVTSDCQTMMRCQTYLIITCQADLRTFDDRDEHIQFSIQLLEPKLSIAKRIFKKHLNETIGNYMRNRDRERVNKSFSYVGPVLFENWSVKDYIFNRIGHNIYDKYTGGSNCNIGDTLFNGNLNIRQLPDIKRYNQRRVWGYEQFDKNGVKPQVVDLVVDGVLVNRLGGRISYLESTAPTGNERFFGVSSGILYMDSPKEMGSKQLRSTFLSKAKEKGLKYAYVIKKSELDEKEKMFQINTETKEERLLICDFQYKDSGNSTYNFSKEKNLIQTRNLEPCSYISPALMYCDNLLIFATPKHTP